jgi:glutaredoxin
VKEFIVVVALLSSLLVHAGTLYKSVRSDGTVVYSDHPPTEGKVVKTFNFSNLPSSPMPESVDRYRDGLKKSMQARLSDTETASKNQPKLFVAQWCGYCKQAKAYLTEKGIAFEEFDIETPNGSAALATVGGGRGIPVLVKNGQRVEGFSRGAYDALFGGSR